MSRKDEIKQELADYERWDTYKGQRVFGTSDNEIRLMEELDRIEIKERIPNNQPFAVETDGY